MYKLLSRITWIISIIFGLTIAQLFGSGRYFSEETFVWGMIGAIILKFALFSPNYIRSRLEFFRTQIQNINSSEASHNIAPDNSLPEENISKEENLEIFDNSTNLEEYNSENITSIHTEEIKESKKEPNIIQQFFAENLLAKIGGIIVFIGVLFFMSVIYSVIGPVGKTVLGFMFGFAFYGAGVLLEKKGFSGESHIVMGVGILINYLVILSARHLLGDTQASNGAFLTVGTTFLMLILNTVFAVVTALVYKSRSLLIFSFLFAYLNPLLLGTQNSEPYTLLGYTLIVTLGALFLSYSRKDIILFVSSFIFANLLFLIAPWSDGAGWITKLLSINFIGVLSLYVSLIFSQKYKFLSEILIAGVFFLIGILGLLGGESLSIVQFIILSTSSIMLMLISYFWSQKGFYLYSIGTVGTLLTLTPAILQNGLTNLTFTYLSCLIIAVFFLIHVGFILYSAERLKTQNIPNLISGLVSGAIFMVFMIFFFAGEYFPGMLLGFAYAALAILYALSSFYIISKIGIENLKKNDDTILMFYSISALALSIFTLSIAFVFSGREDIISLVWLVEASVLLYIGRKINSGKVLFAFLILFIIGVLRLIPFLEVGDIQGEYTLLTSIAIILGVLLWNIFYINKVSKNIIPKEIHISHNIFHSAALAIIFTLGINIIGIQEGFSLLLSASIFIVLLGILYRYLQDSFLIITTNIALIASYILHIMLMNWLLIFSGSENYEILKSIIILILPLILLAYSLIKENKITSPFLLGVSILYAFIITTLYVAYFVDATFAITLYWGVLAFGVLGYGISKNIVYMRTVGLYLLTLTVGKIFLYDIWQSEVADGVGYIAFMVTGILMIVLSTMYTKKLGNTLGKDFSPLNLSPQANSSSSKAENKNTAKEDSSKKEETSAQSDTLMQDIKSIDTRDIKGVRMHIHGDNTPIQIRAENLTKIAKLITHKYKKRDFVAAELQDIYEYITLHYKSELPANQYKKIKDVVESFVKHGGKIEFIKK